MEPLLIETPGAPRPLRLIAGDIALDFANTIDQPPGDSFDHLARYDDLIGWTSNSGVIAIDVAAGLSSTAAQHPRAAARAVQEAHRLRSIIQTIFAPETDVHQLEKRFDDLRPYLADAFGAANLTLAHDPGQRWQWSDPSDLRTPLRPVAAAAAALLNSTDLGQIKRCANCPWLFVDRSRNHLRRWCDMQDCGHASKVRLAAARRHARSRQTGPDKNR